LFAAHFGRDRDHPAPVIEVSGRTYPVEIRYRPLGQEGVPEDQPTAIAAAVRELLRQGDGDILVFCSGEREIRDAADTLVADLGARLVSGKSAAPGKMPDKAPRPPLEILPLYSRLSAADQHRVFESHSARRVVLATNVAETSLTVPGIHYVIDPGTARISRYSKATKVQRLPIEPVSQASANQRAGRCGRIAAGVCIRLYSEEDFESRPPFTEPEILRTSLAAVILQMLAVGVVDSAADVARFPFVQPPDTRAVTDGVRVLEELGAIQTAGADRRKGARGGQRGQPRKNGPKPDDRGGNGGNRGGGSNGDSGAESTDPGGCTQLTPIGRELARIPLDPRLARMIVEASKLGVEREVTIIAAALSIQDPRERPLEFQAQADQSHARFNDPGSDFLSFLNLWEYLRSARKAGSSSAFRRLVRREYLNYLRIREWQDLVKELGRAVRASPGPRQENNKRQRRTRSTRPMPSGAAPTSVGNQDGDQRRLEPDQARLAAVGNQEGGPRALEPDQASLTAADNQGHDQWRLDWPAEQIHRALLAGLVSRIGMRQVTNLKAKAGRNREEAAGRDKTRRSNQYLGARGISFAIFPGSVLRNKPPAWLMEAELVETSRLWARTTAAIDPEWVEQAAPHLLKRSYAEPRWSAKRGAAIINEKVLVYGLPVVTARPVALERIDRAAARELFIRHALVEGDWRTDHEFYARNRELIDQAEALAARSRLASPVIDDEDLFDFYDQRLPTDVTSTRRFDAWWKKVRPREPDRLTLTPRHLAEEVRDASADFPEQWVQGDISLPLSYEYAPGSDQDGVTVHIPVATARRLAPEGFDWQVPGLRGNLIAALIRTLPKGLRAELLPAQATAAQALQALGPPSDWRGSDGRPQPLTEALAHVFKALRGVYVAAEAWNPAAIPDFLKITFQVEDPKGRTMAQGHDLATVVAQATADVPAAIERVAAASQVPDADQSPALSQSCQVTTSELAGPPKSAPATNTSHRPEPVPPQRDLSRRNEIREELLAALALGSGRLTSRLRPEQALPLAASRYPAVADLTLDVQRAVIEAEMGRRGLPADQNAYDQLRDDLRESLEDTVYGALATASALVAKANRIEAEASRVTALPVLNSILDIKGHLARLMGAGFISRAGTGRFKDLERYLKAEEYRLERLGVSRAREDRGLAELEELAQAVRAAAAAGTPAPVLEQVEWMIEELRVSLFARPLGTAYPVSAKRVRAALRPPP
jgi:ATP-dependent helicase HrpA